MLAPEEIKRGVTRFCLQLLSCMAGLLTPIWEEQMWKQFCLLVGSVLVQRDRTPSPPRCHGDVRQGGSFVLRQGDGTGEDLT